MAEASLSRRFLQFGRTGICVVRPQVILFFGTSREDRRLARERAVSGDGKMANNDVRDASASGLARTGRSQQSEREQLTNSLHEGMDVYDNQNHKIGTVRKIYSHVGPGEEFFIKVVTAFPGLGHTPLSSIAVHTRILFIPSSYLKLWRGQLELTVERSDIDQMGWDKRPVGIRD